ncbi:hypothetical protein CVCC1112_2621 [Paenarthrobacter nicotinovorans]|uniref:hypothetical protein n=1 Tax=Paenarthrobacter nicotinovorans TaxID=29320 RepID=UPI0007CCB3CF|nr:hypothetical protein [Paenarthrobacter nicotinovorans]GAT87962.1 hypothetical protein CVCC1112_2621 [Paenarthrobacter nicotinovorans]
MGKTAVLAIRIVTDAKAAKPGIDSTSASLGKLDTAARASGNGVVTSFNAAKVSATSLDSATSQSSASIVRGMDNSTAAAGRFSKGMQVAQTVGVAALAGLAALAKSSGDAASKLEQSTGGVETVFGNQSAAIIESARGAANAVGLSRNAYQEFATGLGGQLKGLGIDGNAVVGTTQDLIKSAADLAATYGGSTSDAVSALGSLLRGEADPIERFNIFIKQSDVNARLAAQGLDKLEGEALKAAETQARLAMFTEQAAITNGKFAAEANTAAGSSERFKAQVENSQAALGTMLLPALTLGAQILGTFAAWVEKNAGLAQTLAVIIGTTTIAVLAMNLALSLNPIGLVVIAVAALVAGIVILIDSLGGIENVLNQMGNWFRDTFNMIGGLWDGFMGWVNDGINALKDFLGLNGRAASSEPAPSSFASRSSFAAVSTFGAAPQVMSTSTTAPDAAPQGFMSRFAAPQTLAAAPSLTSSTGSAKTAAAVAMQSGDTNVENHYHLNFENAFDARETARRVRKALEELDRSEGVRTGKGGVKV